MILSFSIRIIKLKITKKILTESHEKRVYMSFSNSKILQILFIDKDFF